MASPRGATAPKKDLSKLSKIPFSHEGVARTDRIYFSQDFPSEDYSTTTTYIGITTLD